MKMVALALLVGLITYFIHGILNNFLDTDKASAGVWGFLGILVAMDLKKAQGTRHEAQGTRLKAQGSSKGKG
jgi:hypothetical protein